MSFHLSKSLLALTKEKLIYKITNLFQFIQWNQIKKKKEREREREQETMLYKVSKVHNEATPLQENNEININLTISSPISGVMLMLLLLSLRASEVAAPSDL